MLSTLNQQLFLLMNAPLGLHGLALDTAIFAAKYLIYVALLVLAGLWLWGGTAQRQAVIMAAISAVLALVVSAVIGHLWFQPRPFTLGLGQTYLHHSPDSSFPSDHVTFLAAISLMLLSHASTRVAGVMLVLMTLAVAWARIYVGIHFPLDMLGAFILGLLAVLLVLRFKTGVQKHLLPAMTYVYRKLFYLPIRWSLVKN